MKNFYSKPIAGCMFVLILLFSAIWDGYSQPNVITGTVLSASNSEPVIGAVVRDMKSNVAVVTDSQGKFRITAPQGVTIEVSCLGYVTLTTVVDSRTNYNLVLEEDTKMIEDVVVVG